MESNEKKSIDVNSIINKKTDNQKDPFHDVVRGESLKQNKFFNHEIKITKGFVIVALLLLLFVAGSIMTFFYYSEKDIQFGNFGKVDLAVENFKVHSEMKGKDIFIKFNYIISNLGKKDLLKSTDVEIFENGKPIKKEILNNLGKNESVDLSYEVKINNPVDFSSIYKYEIRTNSNKNFKDANEVNNNAAYDFKLPPADLPDLIVKDAIWDKNLAKVIIEYCNNWVGVGKGKFSLQVSDDQGAVLNKDLNLIAVSPKPGECIKTSSINLVKTDNIKDKLVIMIDWDNKIQEAYEDNNILNKKVSF